MRSDVPPTSSASWCAVTTVPSTWRAMVSMPAATPSTRSPATSTASRAPFTSPSRPLTAFCSGSRMAMSSNCLASGVVDS